MHFLLETVVSVGAVGVSTYFFCSINNCCFPFLAGCGEVGKQGQFSSFLCHQHRLIKSFFLGKAKREERKSKVKKRVACLQGRIHSSIMQKAYMKFPISL